NNGLSIVINYNSNLFTHQTIERFSCHLVQILKSITKNKKNYISDINVMTEEEINQILFDFNKTDYTYPKINTICELFEAQVKKNPTKIAVVFEDNTLTYMELNKKANSLARNLREQGVRPDSIVSLLVEKSIEMVVGILGVLKAGGAYLPIDPSYPKDRIEYILKDSRSEVLLTNIKLNNKIDFKYKIIDLLDEELYGRETEDLDKLHTSRNLAYVIYTSGTTGEPKGVMVEHKGVINLINSSKKKFNLNSNKKILQFASIAFDASAWEIYMGILLGAEVHVISKNLAMDICKLNTYIKRNEINITLLPPFVANEIEIEDTELEVIITGGSESNRSLASRVGKKLNYVNAYGPTENSICTTMWKYEGTINKSVPIGKAVDNNKIYILDKLNNILPIGIAGELCISGDGLARGYLNKNELTCQKFIDNPFEAGTKMYKTGDLARWLPDGNIEYLGRKDNQVKIRGYRIELGEIENKLLENNNIKEAVVLVKENKRKYLCAYIVSDKTVEELDIKEYLKKKLPEYMIPAHFVLLKSMPLTPNEKINNRLLPEPDTNNLNANYQAPRNEIEKTIAEIWGKALEIEKIGVSENFFDLGGDSLSIVIMLHLLNREFGKEIFLDDFLRNPTISYLATLIAAEKN
ncbi:non-ribosomal peptide synthetase, partial [Bacillus thuringiensis]|uniref:non-ribosomal peptide synthetase n=1 Tax=Bacillus thuringiensis TaxID=1428 RepID=UPI0030000C96